LIHLGVEVPEPQPDPEPQPEPDPDPEPDPEPDPVAWRPDPQLWKVTLPVAGSNGKPLELYPFREYPPHVVFRNDGVLFNAPCVAISTENSKYPRSELREMTRSGGLAAWSNAPGAGEHHMAVDLTITRIPVVKPHLVVGQIHDKDDDVIMIRLEGK